MKTSYRYSKIDAFTAGHSLGNPAACLYLEPGQTLSDAEMLSVARQHKGFVSEVVYCTAGENDIRLVYYSSECEVGFCGHGTIACLYGLIRRTPALQSRKEILVRTRQKGTLTVYNRIQEQDAVFITAPAPKYLGTRLTADAVASALGLPVQAIGTALPIDCIDAGLHTLIVPLRDLSTVVSVFPGEQALQSFCVENGVDIILIFARAAQASGHIAHTRVFAPRFGYLEDPATGSGNSALGYYMLKNKLWDGSDCRIEQGGNDRVYNGVRLSSIGGAVLFGGSATVRIDGVYYV